MNYNTPGVYVEEVSKLPASVAQSETAFPVFIGYTERTEFDGKGLINKPVRIESMMDYDRMYGGAFIQAFEVDLEAEEPHLPASVRFKDGAESPFLMHHALNLFFANGGGACYIVSVGGYTVDSEPNEPDLEQLRTGLESIEHNDEITLVVIPEAVKLSDQDHYELYEKVLFHNQDQVNRFGIFDLAEGGGIDDALSAFRENVNSGGMDKAAAYYPYLKTTIRYPWQKNKITFKSEPFKNLTWQAVDTIYHTLELQKQFERLKEQVEQYEEKRNQPESDFEVVASLYKKSFRKTEKAFSVLADAEAFIEDDSFGRADPEDILNRLNDDDNLFGDLESRFDSLEGKDKKMVLLKELVEDGTKVIRKKALEILAKALEEAKVELENIIGKINEETNSGEDDQNEKILKYFSSDFTSALKKKLDDQRLTMPPSPAIAGVYAKVDAGRGVWKSPANVSLNRVSAPSVKLTVSENDRLNVHSSGKSINAIRSFPGKGTLVWGGRTLDGRSDEWRYISVRRFFNMVEDSVKSASNRFVFEPNNAGTWVKVKAMIENFLTTQWRAGALTGAKPEEAFYVHVGPGETMEAEDILEGKMIIETGMAVVRPAEFIVLRFSHKMMES